jgi:hypothetical protein
MANYTAKKIQIPPDYSGYPEHDHAESGQKSD